MCPEVMGLDTGMSGSAECVPFCPLDTQECPLSTKVCIQDTETLFDWRGTTQPRSDGTVEEPNRTDYLRRLRPNRNCTFSFFVKGYNSAVTLRD